MKRIEQSCHVGNASISRFCRRIGLRDFFELRELVGEVPFQASTDTADTFAGRMAAHRDSILAGLDSVVDSLQEEKVHILSSVTAGKWVRICPNTRDRDWSGAVA